MHAVVRDWRTAPLDERDRALCRFAIKLTETPSLMSPADVEALREQGLDDRAVHDLVQTVGFFNYITRVAEGLGVEPERFIPRWGR